MKPSHQKQTGVHNPIRVGMLSLGCPKTLVDSEVILGKLPKEKYVFTDELEGSDIAILNTCAFIQDAQEEAIGTILKLLDLKKTKKIGAVVVIGCFVQRFPESVQKSFKEVDGFVGSGEYDKIPEILEKIVSGKKAFLVGSPGWLMPLEKEDRVALTPLHYRYLKISEGCDRLCSFCTIPSFRGKQRSKTLASLIQEAKELVGEGAREIILTGQDTTALGRDQGKPGALGELLLELDKIQTLKWIRLLYTYPSDVNSELIKIIGQSKKICHYLDIPLQHINDKILRSMKRGITKKQIRELLKRCRQIIQDLVLRTSFIVGFPGETEADFGELLEFMEEIQFERLGIFTYSKEKGTEAAKLPHQVSEKIKEKRFHQAMQLQQKISIEVNQRFLGKKLMTLIESQDVKDPSLWIGRSYMDAPEVDGSVFVRAPRPLQVGSFYPVTITHTEAYDLVGKI